MTALFARGHHPMTDVPLGAPFPAMPAESPLSRALAAHLRERNIALGLPACAQVSKADRAAARTIVARELFAAEHGRSPADARELSSFIAAQSKRAPDAVAGYDLTFSPVKSVSAFWALAPREIAKQIEEAHKAAVGDTMAWLERNAAFTRLGHNGIRQVETRGLIAAAFLHRDSRAGDPDLHTHVAVSNKVQTLDGLWRALDGRVLHQAAVAASERYNTRLEAQLVARLGVRFVERPDRDPSKRPVREIDGIDPRLLEMWSSRRAAIDPTAGANCARVPARARQAADGLGVDRACPAGNPGDAAGQARTSIRGRTTRWLAIGCRRAARRARRPDDARRRSLARRPVPRVTLDDTAVATLAGQVVDTVSSHRATWQVWHVRAEAERQARAFGIPAPMVDETVDRIVAAGLREHSIALTDSDPVQVPAGLRRSDGSSVYRVSGADKLHQQRDRAAEQQLLEAAAQQRWPRGQPAGPRPGAARGGRERREPQRRPGRSRPRARASPAPGASWRSPRPEPVRRPRCTCWPRPGARTAGTCSAWLRPPPRPRVLRDVTRTPHRHDRQNHAQPRQRTTMPDWMARLGPRSLVIIDEAGMAGTADLAASCASYSTSAAASVLSATTGNWPRSGPAGSCATSPTTFGAATSRSSGPVRRPGRGRRQPRRPRRRQHRARVLPRPRPRPRRRPRTTAADGLPGLVGRPGRRTATRCCWPPPARPSANSTSLARADRLATARPDRPRSARWPTAPPPAPAT